MSRCGEESKYFADQEAPSGKIEFPENLLSQFWPPCSQQRNMEIPGNRLETTFQAEMKHSVSTALA